MIFPCAVSPSRSLRLLVIVLAVVLILTAIARDCAAKKLEMSWEQLVQTGNDYADRVLTKAALKYYFEAVELMEEEKINDIRAAVVYKDIAAMYNVNSQRHMVKIYEDRCAGIYKHEMENGRLGSEYAKKENQDPLFITLRPACPLCHKINKVIPIHYENSTESGAEVKNQDDARVWRLSSDFSEERWYCRACKQLF